MTSLRARFRGLPPPAPAPARTLLVAKMRAKNGQLATMLTVRARPQAGRPLPPVTPS